MSKVKKVKLEEITTNFDKLRIPLSSSERSKLNKIYPYYGAQSIVDYVDKYLFDGEYLLVAEDGENLKSQNSNVCNYVKGKFWVNNHAHILQAKDDNNLKYIYYLLNLKDFRPYVTGSAQPKLTQDNLNKMVLLIHEPCDQIKIATVLSSLDDKIELNNSINAELEQMAKTIYDYWFVQFDFPISAEYAASIGKPEMEGKPYKSSGGKMVWSEELKREVPGGWELKELSEIAEIKAGGDRPKVYSSFRSEQFKIPIFSNGITNEGLYGYTDKAKIFKQSITVTGRGANVGYSVLRNTPFLPIIRLLVITPNFPFYSKFLFESLQNINFLNSGSAQPQITVPQVSSLSILMPGSEILRRYDALTSASVKAIEINKEETQKLIELRDWLLPMLINGQVKVVDEVDDEMMGMAAEPVEEYKVRGK